MQLYSYFGYFIGIPDAIINIAIVWVITDNVPVWT